MNLLDFSNNLLNWLLLVVLLVWLWMKVTPGVFAARKESIESALKEAEQARLNSEQFLNEQKSRIADAEAEAEKILSEAKSVAATMAAEIKKQAEQEEAALKERIQQQIQAEMQMAKTEMRRRTATVAVRLAEAGLPSAITDSSRGRLHDEFVKQLESGGVKT